MSGHYARLVLLLFGALLVILYISFFLVNSGVLLSRGWVASSASSSFNRYSVLIW